MIYGQNGEIPVLVFLLASAANTSKDKESAPPETARAKWAGLFLESFVNAASFLTNAAPVRGVIDLRGLIGAITATLA